MWGWGGCSTLALARAWHATSCVSTRTKAEKWGWRPPVKQVEQQLLVTTTVDWIPLISSTFLQTLHNNSTSFQNKSCSLSLISIFPLRTELWFSLNQKTLNGEQEDLETKTHFQIRVLKTNFWVAYFRNLIKSN
jgi:hypothetical protein